MQNKVRFIHSLSTAPMLTNCYNLDGLQRLLTQVWYFSLSVAYLKRIGAEIVLHTDSLGKAMLGHLPYDEIKLTLDNEDATIHPRYWASAKFRALAHEEAPCIHIDGDVFIKRADLVNTLSEALNKHDIIFQGYDAAVMYTLEIPLYEKDKEFCKEHFCEPDGTDAYNTGILGFGNEQTRKMIVDNYFKIARHFSEIGKEELDTNTNLTPDLIAEQKMMQGIVKAKDLKHWILLDKKKNAIGIGYQHVYTIYKHDELPNCMQTLKRISPAIYEQTSKLAKMPIKTDKK